jgi:hypothetical protein
MVVVRDVYEAKYGRGAELVTLLKDINSVTAPLAGREYRQRILSDASGPFFTIVQEMEVASIGEWERLSREMFASKEFQKWFPRWLELVQSGRREFYNVEV